MRSLPRRRKKALFDASAQAEIKKVCEEGPSKKEMMRKYFAKPKPKMQAEKDAKETEILNLRSFKLETLVEILSQTLSTSSGSDVVKAEVLDELWDNLENAKVQAIEESCNIRKTDLESRLEDIVKQEETAKRDVASSRIQRKRLVEIKQQVEGISKDLNKVPMLAIRFKFESKEREEMHGSFAQVVV